MKKSVLWLGGVFALAVGLSLAQSVAPRDQAAAAPKPTKADLEWAALVEVRPAAKTVNQLHADDRPAAHVDYADQLRQFRKDHPDDSRAPAARAEEALSLIRAELLGERGQRERRDELVAAARRDASLPAKKRLEVAAKAENAEVLERKHASREAMLGAFETKARGLIQEFPGEVGAWEGLFRIGLSGSDAEALRIMRDLLAMNAPEPIRSNAALYLARQDLVGRSLAVLLADTGLDEETVKRLSTEGTEAVFYAWSVKNPASMEVARRLGANAPPGGLLIGLNVDNDVEAARAAAAAALLPGDLLYDEKGREGAVAKALLLTNVPLVYRRNAQGALSSVTVLRELSAPAPTLNPAAP